LSLAGLAWRYFLDGEEKKMIYSAKDKLVKIMVQDMTV